jgi:hypothetical protein
MLSKERQALAEHARQRRETLLGRMAPKQTSVEKEKQATKQQEIKSRIRLNKLSRPRVQTPPITARTPQRPSPRVRPRLQVLRKNAFEVLSDDPHIKGAIGAMERIQFTDAAPSFMLLMKELQTDSKGVISFDAVVDAIMQNSKLPRRELRNIFKLVHSPETLLFRYMSPKAIQKRQLLMENADVITTISSWWRSIRACDRSMESHAESDGFSMRKRRFSAALDLKALQRRAHNTMGHDQYLTYISALFGGLPGELMAPSAVSSAVRE